MVELSQVSRAGFYSCRNSSSSSRPRTSATHSESAKTSTRFRALRLEFPSYGRPRITAELKRRGWLVNHKRVHRILREDNLLCLRRRKFVVTTDSGHALRVYPNRARQMVLTDVDQLWRADITYVRLQEEFVFLAVVLDAYSRRVIGWALDRTLETGFALADGAFPAQRGAGAGAPF